MTIAAGFVCSDGLLICADTEHTDYIAKFEREKVLTFDDYLLLTGAGTSDYIKMAFDKLCDEYRTARPVNQSDARAIAEKLVLEVYKEHIFSFYDPHDNNRPSFDLIVGTRCTNGELALVRTTSTASVLREWYDACGSGVHIFEYWAKLFYKPEMTMDLLAYLVLFILREVKRNVLGCGGSSHIVRMPRDAKEPIIRKFYNEDMLLAGFPESAVDILIQCRDLSIPDKRFEGRLDSFVKAIRDIRNAERSKRLLDAEVRKLSKAAASSPENQEPPEPKDEGREKK